MLGWIARWEISRPSAEYLKNSDYDSVWGAAFRWCNQDPETSDAENASDDVKQVVQRFLAAFFKGDLSLRRRNGLKAPNEDFFIMFWDINPWRNALWRCRTTGELDKPLLSALYVERSEVLAWCETLQVAAPAFWSRTPQKEILTKRVPLENRSKDESTDRLVCQAIARIYWEIDPNIHPAHLASSRAIKLYGNGKFYSDESTVKNWINDVDPRKGQRKTGRPEKIPYRIDLETGRLEE